MKTNSKMLNRRHKIDTDQFEFSWHSIGGEEYLKSVWATPTYVGPEAYNAGHIDYILDGEKNNVRHIMYGDDGRYICRKNLDKGRAKFIP